MVVFDPQPSESSPYTMGTFGSVKGNLLITHVVISVWLIEKERVRSAGPAGGEISSSNGDRARGSRTEEFALADPLTYVQVIAGSSMTSVVDLSVD